MDDRIGFAPPCGPILGRRHGAVVRATGIPYARASRFRSPEPVADWTVPFDAIRPAPACPQVDNPALERLLGSALGELPQNEACQNLSVTIPAEIAPDERLPVVVWIHGGSHVVGAGDAPMFDPVALVTEQRLVFVAVTFRLGLFGALGDGTDRPANLALLDQVAALRWVRRNIAAFGGEPTNVTAAGQSAGAEAIAWIMALPEAPALFCRAILHSPPLGLTADRDAMHAAMMDVARTVPVDAPADRVVAHQPAVADSARRFGVSGMMPFGPQPGHAPLPPASGIEAGRAANATRIDLLIGYTAEETRLFVSQNPAIARIFRMPLVGAAIRRLTVRWFDKRVYRRAIHRLVRMHAAAGGRATLFELVWQAPRSGYGSAHAIDLPLLFGSGGWRDAAILGGCRRNEIDAAGTALRRLWGEFAHDGTIARQTGLDDILCFTTLR